MKKLLFTISMLLLLASQAQSAGLVISNILESRCLNNGSFTWSVSARVPANTYRLLVSQIPTGVSLNMLYPDTVAINLFAASYAVDLLENGVSIKKDTVIIPGSFVNPTAFLDSISQEVCPFTGKIHTRITGGRAPFTFVLRNSGGTILATQTNNGVFIGMTAGTYSVQITDSCGNVRNVAGINVTSLGGLRLRFGNSNMAVGTCNVNNCNTAAHPVADVFGQTCSGLGIIATAQIYSYPYNQKDATGLFRAGLASYYHTRVDMTKPFFLDTAYAWTGDFTQPMNLAPNTTSTNTDKLIGMVGGIPPYRYFLRTPSGTILGPQSRPVWYNQPMGGIYMIIGEDACGTRDTLRTMTSSLPSLDSLTFVADGSLQNTCAPSNQQTYSGYVALRPRADSLRVNTAVIPGDFRRQMWRNPGVGPYKWEIESTTDPSFVLPPSVTSWARISGGNFANPNATNTASAGGIQNSGNAEHNAWQMGQGNFPVFFKPTYNYSIKVTDQCGQVQRLNIAPAVNTVDSVEKPNVVEFVHYGCEDKIGLRHFRFPSKPNRERMDFEMYDTTGALIYRRLDAYVPVALDASDPNQGNYVFKTSYAGGLQSFVPYQPKYIMKITGKCTGRIIYDTISVAKFNTDFQVTPIQPCLPGGLGSLKLKRTYIQLPGTTNSPKVVFTYGNTSASPPIVSRGYWTPDSILNNVNAFNSAKVFGSQFTAFNNSLVDSLIIPNIGIGRYTVLMNPAMFEAVNLYYWGNISLCKYAHVNILDYNSLVVSATAEAVCTPDTTGDIQVNATAGRAPFRYQIKEQSQPSYGPMQSSSVFVNRPVGVYNLRVTDTCGNANVINATLAGLQAFTIQNNSPLCAGSILRLRATTNQVGLQARWYKDGVLIAGATKYIYNLYNAQAADAGVYKLVLSDTSGTCGADSAQVTISIVAGGTVTASGVKSEYCQGDTCV